MMYKEISFNLFKFFYKWKFICMEHEWGDTSCLSGATPLSGSILAPLYRTSENRLETAAFVAYWID